MFIKKFKENMFNSDFGAIYQMTPLKSKSNQFMFQRENGIEKLLKAYKMSKSQNKIRQKSYPTRYWEIVDKKYVLFQHNTTSHVVNYIN